MAVVIALMPKALKAKDAAEYLGLTERQLASRVRDSKIKKQPDGAFSIKHLDEYQAAQEMEAGCKVIGISNGNMAREEAGVDSEQADSGAEEVFSVRSKRSGGRRSGAQLEADKEWPSL